MNLQLTLFDIDDYISKKKPVFYTQNEDENLSVGDDISLNYDLYPSEDDEPMAQDDKQAKIINKLKNVLDYIFYNRDTVFVGMDMFLYLERYKVKAPDIMVSRDVKPEEHKKSYIIKREGKAPDVAIEVLSTSNYKDKKDLKKRFDFYAKCKIKEFYVIHTQPNLWIDIYFLVNNSSYNKILDFPQFYDDYLECAIYVEDSKVTIKDKNNELIEDFTQQVIDKKEAQKQAKEEAQARKQAEKQAEKAEKAQKQAEKQAKEEAQARKQAEKQANLETEARIEAEEKNKQLWFELEELRNLLKQQKTEF